ncbi:polysaccharide deacetylase family protein [Cohnella kolymensis]|uniref:polysaccharide deacetylase family protein n=1 Tax=Cohnella kolymensis TaxID=1590652 RepID=UPI001F4487A6|nr:polysaccharide deacetylase family protein [Cohnella kolymensis]
MAIRCWRKSVMVLLGAVTLLFSGLVCSAADKPPPGSEWSELQRRYRGVFVLSAPRESRKVALTFDDVPDPRFTPQVLDVLNTKHVRATFFVVGTRMLKHPDLLKRIDRDGHDIGNHSYSHPDFSRIPLDKVQQQIIRSEEIVEKLVGFKPKLVRPPYGEIRPAQLDWAKQQGYTVVNWDVDSRDWRQLTADEVFRNVTSAVRPGSVILMHAGGGEGQNLLGTVQALPRIIDWLRNHHYEPVPLTELLDVRENREDSTNLFPPFGLP